MKPHPKGPPLQLTETLTEQATSLNEYRNMVLRMHGALPFPYEDVRKALFMRLLACVSVYLRMMNLVLWGKDNPRQLEMIYGLTDPTSSAFREATEDLFDAGRIHFIVGSQFQIENCLKALLRAIDPSNQSEKYWNIAQDILQKCDIPGQGDKHQALNVPAIIRNGLHTNGFHTRQDRRFEVAGVVYEFKKDQPITCATLEELQHAMTESVKVLYEIVLSEKSRRIPLIEDLYTKSKREGRIT